jgi:hypothetical protein
MMWDSERINGNYFIEDASYYFIYCYMEVTETSIIHTFLLKKKPGILKKRFPACTGSRLELPSAAADMNPVLVPGSRLELPTSGL